MPHKERIWYLKFLFFAIFAEYYSEPVSYTHLDVYKRQIKDLQAELTALRAQGKKVGLVPTMGALHAGHASLVTRSVSENGVNVVSVFVNPTPFNDKNDLEKYPRTLDADCRLLEECGDVYKRQGNSSSQSRR